MIMMMMMTIMMIVIMTIIIVSLIVMSYFIGVAYGSSICNWRTSFSIFILVFDLCFIVSLFTIVQILFSNQL